MAEGEPVRLSYPPPPTVPLSPCVCVCVCVCAGRQAVWFLQAGLGGAQGSSVGCVSVLRGSALGTPRVDTGC